MYYIPLPLSFCARLTTVLEGQANRSRSQRRSRRELNSSSAHCSRLLIFSVHGSQPARFCCFGGFTAFRTSSQQRAELAIIRGALLPAEAPRFMSGWDAILMCWPEVHQQGMRPDTVYPLMRKTSAWWSAGVCSWPMQCLLTTGSDSVGFYNTSGGFHDNISVTHSCLINVKQWKQNSFFFICCSIIL